MSARSLSRHVIPTSITVVSRFLLSQINNSGLLLLGILTLVPTSVSFTALSLPVHLES